MYPTLKNIVKTAVRSSGGGLRNERFSLQGETAMGTDAQESVIEIIASLAAFIIMVIILSLIGQYLWNRIVAGAGNGSGVFTGVKPIKSIAEMIGLYLIISMLLN